MHKALLFSITTAYTLVTVCTQDSTLYKKQLALAHKGVVGIYVHPDSKSTFNTQTTYGHEIKILEKVNDIWSKVRLPDGSWGYSKNKELIKDNVLWRTSNDLQRIKSIYADIYPDPDITKNQSFLRLPYNAYIKNIGESPNKLWTQVELIDGSTGWIKAGNIEPIRIFSTKEAIERALQFIGVPYIWGGASSFGYDCSGFTQLIAQQMGYPMKRNSRAQSQDSGLLDIAYEDIKPGDFLFFNGIIARQTGYLGVNHVTLYLGNNKMLHAANIDEKLQVLITEVDHPALIFICAKRIPELTYRATIQEIDDVIFKKMKKSWQEHNPVPLKELRYLRMRYWGFDNCVHTGEMIVHAEVAQEVVDIFKELFEQQYPIERMKLIDEYDAIDGLSCADNNSSAFCSRLLTNSTTKWSLHSFGIAIDVNTRINPYHKGDYIGPANGKPFLDRTVNAKGLIKKGDACDTAFKKHNWKWAGEWQEKYGYVDYQHYYKESHMSDALIKLAQKYTPKLD